MHSHNGPSPAGYPFESGRRRSLGGGSPQGYYGGSSNPVFHTVACSACVCTLTSDAFTADTCRIPGPLDPPPPPPSFIARTMPPPSSPQQPQPAPQRHMQRAPPASGFPGGRDLPSLSSLHRQGSSMSISSIIGTDTSGSQQHAQRSPSSTVTAPSPLRGLTSSDRPEAGVYHRPRTPERYPHPAGSRLVDLFPGPASSPNGAFAAPRGSPDQTRQPLPHTQRIHTSFFPPSSLPYQSSPTDTQPREHSRPGEHGIPPRPNSQPIGTSVPLRDMGASSRYSSDMAQQRTLFGPAHKERRSSINEQHQPPRLAEARPAAPGMDANANQGRPTTGQHHSQSIFGSTTHYDPTDPRQNHFNEAPPSWRGPDREGGPRPAASEASGHHPEAFGSGHRNNGLTPAQGSSPVPTVDGSRRHAYSLEPKNAPTSDPFQNGQAVDANAAARRRSDISASSASSTGGPRAAGVDQHQRKQLEEMDKQRHLLGVSPDSSRKPGRASPLPQAVQGAQAQMTGPGGDPTIKSEFGRMFSGLGSGLSSAPPNPGVAANGYSTPSRLSPFPQRFFDGAEMSPLAAGLHAETSKMQRTSSLPGRVRRFKDEEGMTGIDGGDGRRTPSLLGHRGSKRPKHAHPGYHHHHHHPLGHQ